MDSNIERVDITVHGRVQGVAFRWYTQSKALSLGLKGWVLNQVDGSVRIVAEGPRRDLEVFCEWIGRGPDHAREYAAVVLVEDERLGSGSGPSKKQAEQNAAEQACRALGVS